VGKALRRSALTIDDVEDATGQILLQRCFSTVICTGMGYEKGLGRKQRRTGALWHYTFIHPRRFKADAEVLRGEGVEPSAPYVVIRLTSWLAMHDIGCKGLTEGEVGDIAGDLSRHGRVLISAEGALPASLARYANPVSAGNVFHLLAFAQLFIGEGASMPAEAACLGTPAIWASPQRRGYLTALEKRYGLVERITDPERIKERARQHLTDAGLRERVKRGHERFLAEAEDPLEVMVRTIDELGNRNGGYRGQA